MLLKAVGQNWLAEDAGSSVVLSVRVGGAAAIAFLKGNVTLIWTETAT